VELSESRELLLSRPSQQQEQDGPLSHVLRGYYRELTITLPLSKAMFIKLNKTVTEVAFNEMS